MSSAERGQPSAQAWQVPLSSLPGLSIPTPLLWGGGEGEGFQTCPGFADPAWRQVGEGLGGHAGFPLIFPFPSK